MTSRIFDHIMEYLAERDWTRGWGLLWGGMLRSAHHGARRLAHAPPCGAFSTIERPSVEVEPKARVVVVGGGIIGCSVAYHLAKLGWQDIMLLERDNLTSGTTWHAAGLMVTFGSLVS